MTSDLCAPAADRCSSRRWQANQCPVAIASAAGTIRWRRLQIAVAHIAASASDRTRLGGTGGDLQSLQHAGPLCARGWDRCVRAGIIAHADRRRQPTTATGVVAASTRARNLCWMKNQTWNDDSKIALSQRNNFKTFKTKKISMFILLIKGLPTECLTVWSSSNPVFVGSG